MTELHVGILALRLDVLPDDGGVSWVARTTEGARPRVNQAAQLLENGIQLLPRAKAGADRAFDSLLVSPRCRQRRSVLLVGIRRHWL